MIVIRLIYESFRFALNALRMNPLRTSLSLAGVTVGIFVIIGVFTLVDSLEKGLKDSFSFLGNGIVYIQKWPFIGSADFPWWKYISRPMATYDEYQYLEENLKHHKGICIFATRDGLTVKYGNNSATEVSLLGGTYGYKDVFEFDLEEGRYFTLQEAVSTNNLAIIGIKIKEQLFPNEEAVNREIKVRGLKFKVIGVFKEEGESLLDTPSDDELIVIPYFSFKKIFTTGRYDGMESVIGVKGLDEDYELEELRGELTGLMRGVRGMRPAEENNFELNRPEAIANVIGDLFDVLKVVGFVIGLFAILIGGFGIANIMFVSVQERTGIIGIQKSLGAKNYFILLQFLFESVFLSLIGGVIGLLLVYLLTYVPIGRLELLLNLKNIIFAFALVVMIGVIFGILPALKASRMDPVVAIRSN